MTIDLNYLDNNKNYSIFIIENTNTEIIKLIQEKLKNLNRKEIIIKDSNIKEYGDITFYLKEQKVFVANKEIRLPLKELKLLEAFICNPTRLWTREHLLNKIWGEDFYGDAKTVDVHISWLRRNLGLNSKKSKYLITVRGLGYRFL